jgi:alpha-amylase
MPHNNGVMMQYFHWYTAPDGGLWTTVAQEAEALASKGITALWLPPASKGSAGGLDVGYGVYDLFDLGEFDQKESVRTKYGTKDEFIAAVATAKQAGIAIYADAVFNHKLGADKSEDVEATPFSTEDRSETVGDYQPINAWTHFTFPGRSGQAVGLPPDQKQYSNMEWHWWHFDAIDYNANNGEEKAIYLFKGKSFDQNVDLEHNNYAFLMGCDLDMENPEVTDELKAWGVWMVKTTGVSGFRFDAVKHVSAPFFAEWLDHVQQAVDLDLFAVGEYWSYKLDALDAFLQATDGKISLFDAPLHYNFRQASTMGNTYDLRQIFDNTLVQKVPTLAVTLVDNHDSQPLQALESVVEQWFKPLAYALILLREAGYPCVFYPDYYGATYTDTGKDGNPYDIVMPAMQALLDQLLEARKTYAYGQQVDYFDHANCLGWTRLGDDDHKGAMAVVLSNGDAGDKWMDMQRPNTTYTDCTQQMITPVTTNADGWGTFTCKAGSVSVWVAQQ